MHPAAYLCTRPLYLQGGQGANLHNMQDLIGQGYPKGYANGIDPANRQRLFTIVCMHSLPQLHTKILEKTGSVEFHHN